MIKLNVKKLTVKRDDRGWLAEIIRKEDVAGNSFGQLIVTTAEPGKIKGNHYHLRKREWYCVIKGQGRLTITDRKTGEQLSHEMTDKSLELIEIPRGYIHAIENTGSNRMYLLAYTDEPFNPEDPDTYYVDSGK